MKPSSLNYKISLKHAVKEYIKKEAKSDDYSVKVEEEMYTATEDQARLKIYEDFDDALFGMSVSLKNKS